LLVEGILDFIHGLAEGLCAFGALFLNASHIFFINFIIGNRPDRTAQKCITHHGLSFNCLE